MKKPTKKTIVCWDYNKCADYISKKLGKDIRNFAGCKFKVRGKDAPYQDFWHFLIDILNPSRGGFIHLSNEWLDNCTEPWHKEIMEAFLVEFGEGENRECEFHTDW